MLHYDVRTYDLTENHVKTYIEVLKAGNSSFFPSSELDRETLWGANFSGKLYFFAKLIVSEAEAALQVRF